MKKIIKENVSLSAMVIVCSLALIICGPFSNAETKNYYVSDEQAEEDLKNIMHADEYLHILMFFDSAQNVFVMGVEDFAAGDRRRSRNADSLQRHLPCDPDLAAGRHRLDLLLRLPPARDLGGAVQPRFSRNPGRRLRGVTGPGGSARRVAL